MENNENKKAPEELADEALDEVAGGGRLPMLGLCPNCWLDKVLDRYHNPANKGEMLMICAECAGKIGWVK